MRSRAAGSGSDEKPRRWEERRRAASRMGMRSCNKQRRLLGPSLLLPRAWGLSAVCSEPREG